MTAPLSEGAESFWQRPDVKRWAPIVGLAVNRVPARRCRLLDRRGAGGGVVALRDAVRGETGEVTYLWKHGDARPLNDAGVPVGAAPKLLITTSPLDAPGWEAVPWEYAEAKARSTPRRRPMSRVERLRAAA